MYLKTQIENLLRLAQEQESYEPYYEVLEYIQLDGTQYFDTGYYGNLDTKIEARINVTLANQSVFAFMGDMTTSSSAITIPLNSSVGTSGLYSRFGDTYIGTGLGTTTGTHEIVVDKSGFYLDGIKKGTFNATTPFTTVGTLLIGAFGGLTRSYFVGDIDIIKISENNILVHDYVPTLDNQMRPCLYDKISKTFTYAKKISDNTTTYDLGFKRWNKFDVDYIESSGTQYINTGYAFADDFAYEVEYEGLNNGECLLGGRTSSVRTAILYRAMATQVDGQTTVPIAGLNATQTPFKLGVLSDTKHKVKVAIANNKGNVWLDDTQIYTNQSFTGTYISGKTTAIFADHFGDQTGTSEYQEFATSKLYALKFWQGTTLVRDYKPSVWHNGDTTAVACLYDEVYNKMYQNAGTGSFKAYITNISTTKTNVFTTTGATSGKAINAEGTIINSAASSYSDLLPIVGGTVIECVSGDTGNNNYRYHCYDSSGNWIEQSLVLYPEGAGTVSPITGSFTAPANAKYVRVSYATQASSTIQVKSVTENVYEVGMYLKTLKTGNLSTVGPIIELGEYPQDGIGYHIKTTTDSNSSNYLFGSRLTTDGNLQIATLSGSQTGGTILSTVMGESITWKSGTTTWARSGNGTTYECSIQTYKDGNTYKFNAIGYNYTLGKEADRQTQIYTNPIDEQQDTPMLYFGAFNTVNILFGTNSHYFIEWNLPDVRHTLLPVINSTHTKICFIDNKTKQTYEFIKVGSYTPTTNNITFKQLDGTVITGTLT